MTNTTDELRDKLIEEAIALLDECTAEERVDVFKAVAAFYIGTTKSGAKATDGSKAGGTFADIQRRLAGGAMLDVSITPPGMAAKIHGGTA